MSRTISSKLHRRRFSFLLLFVLAAAPGLPAQAPALEGHWEGTIVLPTGKLAFDIDFAKGPDGAWTGDISIPVQNAKDLPLEAISLSGSDVAFAIKGIPGAPAFKGKISDDGKALSGSFTQNGTLFPFSMTRGSSRKEKARAALAGFDALVERGLKALNVPGAAAAVVVEDEIILAKGYGLRNVEEKRPMTADTLLAIGSASKAFTTFALGALVEQGKMAWDVPVRTYIPWFKLDDPFASERLTPRDLVTHRSGLPRHDLVWYNNSAVTREDLVRRLAFLKPTADLRTRFQYNNLMFLTAGYLAGLLNGKSWEESVRGLVLEPLGMARTNFSVEDSQKDTDFAFPYNEDEKMWKRIPFRNITTVGPAGSINSSVGEMAKWVMVHLNNGTLGDKRILNPQTVEDMHLAHMPTGGTPALAEVTPADYGLGWFVDSYRGHRRVHHGGNIDGFSALVSFLPADGVGFVVLTNMNGTALPELLVRHASDLILGAETRDWIAQAAAQKQIGDKAGKEAREKAATRRVAGTKPSHELKDYAGTYLHPGYGPIEVVLKDKDLAFVFNGIATPLEHWHYETFSGKKVEDPTFNAMKLTFRTDPQGRVAALEMPIEPALDPASFVRKPEAKLTDPAYLKKCVGTFALPTQLAVVSLKGDALAIHMTGQPGLDLEPSLGGEFVLKQSRNISVGFKENDKGEITALIFYQPNGVFEAARR